MSLLGFDKVIKNLQASNAAMLKEMMAESQKEFSRNFKEEKNSETGKSWPSLSEETIKRKGSSEILRETGKLEKETLGRNIKTTDHSITLTVDPIDKRGKGYASYHMDGEGVKKREYITTSSSLKKIINEVGIKYLAKAIE